MTITRRHFAAGAAATLALAAFPRGNAPQAVAQAPGARETRTVPSTGEAVPVVGLGTWITFNVGTDPQLLARSTEVMRAFFDEGGGMIDSSPMYGSSQDTVGHGLAELGFPESLLSAEKVWTSSPSGGPEQIAQSLREWRVERFDLMQVHNLLGLDGNLETLRAMKARGEIRYLGVTTSHGRRHRDLERVIQEQPLDFVQLTYNALDREAEDRLLPLAREQGTGVIVNRPYRRGALVDRMRGVPLPGFAGELGASTWAQLLLKFVISHPAVTVAIPATTSPAHMRENKAAARGHLPDEDQRRRIAEIVDEA